MEQEKIKEIKKALEYNTVSEFMNRLPYADKFNKLKMVAFEDILTYINELESENEKLSAKYKNLENNYEYTHKVYREYEEENKQLKERIAELEKQNARLLDSVETVQANRCVYKCVLTKEHLTKFAERLKETSNYTDTGGTFVVSFETIDEALKEFL